MILQDTELDLVYDKVITHMAFGRHVLEAEHNKYKSAEDMRGAIIQPNSIELHLHPQWSMMRPDGEFTHYVCMDSPIILAPGACVLASTCEHVCIPNGLVGKVEGKSSLGRRFIAVHITAGWIDTGFPGQITLELKNLSPAPQYLYPFQRIAQLVLMRTVGECARPYGHETRNSKYVGQVGPTEAK